MRQQAVVLTYPGHFLLTQLTLRSIQAHFPEIQKITVIVDDLNPNAWQGYYELCQEIYQRQPTVKTRPLSDWKEFGKITKGWVRQQMVKLHLDQLIDGDEFFFVDGDIVFDCNIPYRSVPYNYIDMNHIDESQRIYVTNMLGRPFTNIKIDGRAVITSNAAFRDIKAQWLSDLRRYLCELHQTDLISLHENISDYRGITEWELLEFFKKEILGITPEYITLFCYDLADQRNDRQEIGYNTCFGVDRSLDQQWWHARGIDTEPVWQILPSGK